MGEAAGGGSVERVGRLNETVPDCHPKGEPGRKHCVLSIDGGGVRGIITSVILERLESELQALEGGAARIADYFDIVAGTSTGALVACLLVAPDPVSKRPRYTAKDATKFYLQNAAKVFPQKRGWCSGAVRLITSLTGPRYSAAPLETVLKEVFGDLKLTETVKPVVVPSYDIKHQFSVLFSTAQAKSKQIPDCYLRDVCRATTAAPTYFPPYYFKTTSYGVTRYFNMVDGGVAANNPAYIAVSELLKDQPEGEEELKYEDLLVLSLGTGQKAESYDATRAAQWGLLSWVYHNGNVPMLDILLLASQDIVDYSISNAFYQQGCHDNYLRVQTEQLTGSQTQIDNSAPANMRSLVATAEELLRSQAQTRNKLGEFVPDPRWATYDAAISQYASWLVEERNARLFQPPTASTSG